MNTSQYSPFWQRIILLTAGTINLAILLILFSIWRTGDRALSFVGSIFKSDVEQKIEVETAIAHKIREIQELTTTVQTVETIVPASAERKLGDFPVATTRLLYVARGEIRAGVDLSKLTNKDIRVSDRAIEIDLPPAKILDSKIDVNNSRVYDYNRGFLNLGPDVAPQLQTLAQRKTIGEIVDIACDEGILNTANNRAKVTISQLLSSTDSGKEIKVNLTTPGSCGI